MLTKRKKKRQGGNRNYETEFRQLETEGFCIIENVIDRTLIQESLDQIRKYHSWFASGDLKSWPVSRKTGWNGRFAGFSHLEAFWKVRTDPTVLDIFRRVYGNESELVASFDTGNYIFPSHEMQIPLPSEDGHIDQTHAFQFSHRELVQGQLVLLEANKENGTVAFLKKSHKVIGQEIEEDDLSGWDERDKEEDWKENWENDLWYFQESTMNHFIQKGCEWVIGSAPPGSLILWDGRLVHKTIAPALSPSPPPPPPIPTPTPCRAVFFVSYMPWSSVRKREEWKKHRHQAIQNSVSHSGWACFDRLAVSNVPYTHDIFATHLNYNRKKKRKDVEQVKKTLHIIRESGMTEKMKQVAFGQGYASS